MALITCPDCERQVSSSAAACPQCGAPIAARSDVVATGAPLQTVQETSKRLKSQILIASLMFWAGAIWLFTAGVDGGGMTLVSLLLMLSGLAFYIGTKARIWWHHK